MILMPSDRPLVFRWIRVNSVHLVIISERRNDQHRLQRQSTGEPFENPMGEYRTHDSHASHPSSSHRRVPDDSMQLALIVLPETSHKRQRITICRRIHTFVPWTHTENMILMLCIRQGAMEGSPQVRLLAVCGCSSQWLPTRDR